MAHTRRADVTVKLGHKPQQPARLSGRKLAAGTFEDVAFAKRRGKSRRACDLAKAARRKNRK